MNGEGRIIIENRQDGREEGREGEPIPIPRTGSTADGNVPCSSAGHANHKNKQLF
jgi:hypothetical protein